MDNPILSSDPTYGHLTNRQRRYVSALQRRAQHLQTRIEDNLLKDLTYDKHELSALTWALSMIANASKDEHGIPQGQELD